MVQAVLLFGVETWVVTHRMGKNLGGFQNQVTRGMTGRLPRMTLDGRWIYTSAAAARAEAIFLKMEEYIRRRQNTVTHYIATQSLLDLYEGSERAPEVRVWMRWWGQVDFDLAGAWEAAAATAEGDGGEE